jgi:hypothetical protein
LELLKPPLTFDPVIVTKTHFYQFLTVNIMARFQKGILGGFSGTVGTVVGATWRGIDIMRSRPKKTNRNPTPAQAEQRDRFSLTMDFIDGIRPLLRAYFGQPAAEKSRTNLATAYHLTEAITGAYPALTMDFPKVILSKGELLGLQDTGATPQSGGMIKLNWSDNSGQGEARTDDMIFLGVYNEVKKLWQTRQAAEARVTGSYTVDLPDSWVNDTVHCWIGIASVDNKKYSNSEYFGSIVLV